MAAKKRAAKKKVPKDGTKVVARNRARRRGGRTAATKYDVPGRCAEGNVARLKRYQLRAYELRSQNYRLAEISEALAVEFEMLRPVPVSTLSGWLSDTDLAYTADLAKLASQMRLEQFNDLEELRKKWWEIANLGSLEIRRWKMTAEGRVPVIDEDAYDEQIKAASLCVKIMQRQAALLGLDIDKHIEQGGEGPKSMQDLQLWIHAQITYGAQGTADHAGAVDAHIVDPLLIVAGIPEVQMS